MNLAYHQIRRIKSLAKELGLNALITKTTITLEDKERVFHLSSLNLTGTQSGIKGYIKAIDILSEKNIRNHRIEESDHVDMEFLETHHIKTGPDSRFDCDFETISLVTTKNKNTKTLIQDSLKSYVFTGNHYSEIIDLINESPVRRLKKEYPLIYNYLVMIEGKYD